MRRSAALLMTLMIFAAGCGDTSPKDEASGMTDMTDMGGHDEASFSFGMPAEPAEATRTIDIETQDTLMFQPANLEIAVGEVVTLRVTNGGKITHDFTLGDAAVQADHDAEMASMDGGMTMADEPNGFLIPAGQTKELTWRFDTAGTVIYGCHVPGHYAAGMRGDITVA